MSEVYAIFQRAIKKAVPKPIPAASVGPISSHEMLSWLRERVLAFVNTRPDNKEIRGIGHILRAGFNSEADPKKYFEEQFEALKGHLDRLQMTSKSLLNSALNILVTVFLAVSGIGFPLAYCLGLLKKNEEASGHKLIFFAFGAK